MGLFAGVGIGRYQTAVSLDVRDRRPDGKHRERGGHEHALVASCHKCPVW